MGGKKRVKKCKCIKKCIKSSKVRKRKKIVEYKRKPKINQIDCIYKKINNVQVRYTGEQCVVGNDEFFIIENLLKDLQLKYEEIIKFDDRTVINILPGEKKNVMEVDELDEEFFNQNFSF